MEQLNEEFCALIHDANSSERDVLRFINHRPAYHIIAGVFKYYNFGHHDVYVFPVVLCQDLVQVKMRFSSS